MRKLKTHRATLIQDVRDFTLFMKSHLKQFLEEHRRSGFSEEKILMWIIDEELEQVYGLYSKYHEHNQQPYVQAHNLLNNALDFRLNEYTRHFIKAPHLYGDDIGIETLLNRNDLWIMYYTGQYN